MKAKSATFPAATRTEIGSPPKADSRPPTDIVIISTQGKTADEIWGPNTKVLWHHLNNGNGHNFTMAFRDDLSGKPRYGKAQKKWERASDWAYRSIDGENVGKRGRRISLVVYSTNSEGFSRWGCCDADAHDGDWKRAWRLAYGAFLHLESLGLFVVLESSGCGYHVWAIHKEFLNVGIWTQILRNTAKAIGTEIGAGIFEIFPRSNHAGIANGMRVVGSYSPRVNAPNLIMYESLGDLIPFLQSVSRTIGEVKKRSEGDFPDIENKEIGEVEWLQRRLRPYNIEKKSTRNSQLIALSAHIFHQVSKPVAARLAEIQFDTAAVRMEAGKKQHIKEFEAAWAGLLKKWHRGLQDVERDKYEALHSENEKSAFRILRSFALNPDGDSQFDFPVATANLGERVGVTRKGAAHIRDRLVEDGVMKLTKHYEQQVSATRYCWLLGRPQLHPGEHEVQSLPSAMAASLGDTAISQ